MFWRQLIGLFLLPMIALSAEYNLPAGRLPGGVRWTRASVGVEGGIPNTGAMTVHATHNPGDTAAAIQASIDSASSNRVIKLNGGTYNLTGSLEGKNGVVIKGNGVGVHADMNYGSMTVGTGSKSFTIRTNRNHLTGGVRAFVRHDPSIYMEGDVTSYSGTTLTVNVTSTGGSGSHTNWIIVQTNWTVLNFTGADQGLLQIIGTYVDPPSVVKTWSGGLSQGSTTLTLNNTTSLAVGDMIGLDQTNDPAIGALETEAFTSRDSGKRGQGQLAIITGISGNDITISHPVAMTNYVSGNGPQVYRISVPVKMVGFEDMLINNVPQNIALYNIFFVGAANCWVSNVVSLGCEQRHFRSYQCLRNEIRNMICQFTLAYSSQSYGLDFSMTSFSLAENNIFHMVSSPYIFWGGGCCGNIMAYGYIEANKYGGANWQGQAIATHGCHPHMMLFEGNISPNGTGDFEHGSASHNTFFRNRFYGWSAANSEYGILEKYDNAFPIYQCRNNRYISVVGNLLGHDGFHTRYRLQNEEQTGADDYIFYLGYAGPNGDLPNYDTGVTNTVLIAHNYNYANDAIPAAESIGSDTLAESWYLNTSALPGFFGFLGLREVDPTNPSDYNPTNLPAGYRWLNGTNPPAAAAAEGGSSVRASMSGRIIISGRALLNAP